MRNRRRAVSATEDRGRHCLWFLLCCTSACTLAARRTGLLGRLFKIGFLFVCVILLRSALGHSAQSLPALRTVWDGVYVHPQADRGESNFFMHCVHCHEGGGHGLLLSSEDFFNSWRGETL